MNRNPVQNCAGLQYIYMYHAACQAGVPFPDFDTLDQYDTKVASYFIMNDAVQGGSVNYWVSRYQREEVKDKVFSEAMQEKYLDNYFLVG